MHATCNEYTAVEVASLTCGALPCFYTFFKDLAKNNVEVAGIDPAASCMRSTRSTI